MLSDSAQHPREAQPTTTRSAAAARGSLPTLVLLGFLTLVWFLLTQRFGSGDIYAVIGPYACAVSILLIGLQPRAVADWLKPRWRAIGIGLGVGVAMTVLTYPVFRLAVSVVPSLDGHVQSLYSGARSTTLPKALAWVVSVILAEELLFRGALPDALSRHVAERSAYAISLVAYALAQLGTGSLIVASMAVVCGCIWTVERRLTGSLLAPLISHLLWTPCVILLYPVT
jgi:membrane protease YdiL (CAAX protease family)